MEVMFKRKFFGPDHNRYPPKVWITVPDNWSGRLPPGTKVREEKAPEPVINEEALTEGLAASPDADKGKATRPLKKKGAVVEL